MKRLLCLAVLLISAQIFARAQKSTPDPVLYTDGWHYVIVSGNLALYECYVVKKAEFFIGIDTMHAISPGVFEGLNSRFVLGSNESTLRTDYWNTISISDKIHAMQRANGKQIEKWSKRHAFAGLTQPRGYWPGSSSIGRAN